MDWVWVKQTKRFTGWWGREEDGMQNICLVSFPLPLPPFRQLLRWTPRSAASLWAHYGPTRLAVQPSSNPAPRLGSGSRPGPSQDDRQARLTVPVSGGGNDWSANDRCSENSAARKGWRTESWGATVISVMKELKHCLSVPSLQLTSFLRANRRKIRES